MGNLKNKADYSLYKCPYSHLEKEIGHELHGPEGYENTYSVWCACGFKGPVFYLEPEELNLERVDKSALLCDECNGSGEILQDDGSDSMGTLIPCEPCEGTGRIGT